MSNNIGAKCPRLGCGGKLVLDTNDIGKLAVKCYLCGREPEKTDYSYLISERNKRGYDNTFRAPKRHKGKYGGARILTLSGERR